MILWALEAPLESPLVEASLFHVLSCQALDYELPKAQIVTQNITFVQKEKPQNDSSNGDYAWRGSEPTVFWAKL